MRAPCAPATGIRSSISLHTRIAWLLFALGSAHCAFSPAAHATNFDVNSSADDGSPGTLRWAIEQVNAAGAGSHSITFSVGANSTIELDTPLPELDNSLATIELDGIGAGGVTISGHDNHRVLFVAAGNWLVRNVNIVHGMAAGGDGGDDGASGGGGGLGAGGAVFVNGGAHLTVQNVNFGENHAQGGDGGSLINHANGGGGGGGGLGGDGGLANTFAGGGGGGFHGNAGNAGYLGGGGAGGLLLDGQNGGFVTGGLGALLGGNGGNIDQNGQDGLTFGGGGGGGGQSGSGGTAGDFGGGGGAGSNGSGGNGGFGGGGGGGGNSGVGGVGGFGAGNGGNNSQGDGGSGLGGAIFVREGGTLTVLNSNTNSNGVSAGSGAISGQAAAEDLYLMSGVNAQFGGTTNAYSGSIAGAGSLIQNAGVTTLTGANSYSGGTTVSGGRLVGNTDSLQGTISNNSETRFTQSFDGSYNGPITGTGELQKYGAGNLTLTNTNNQQTTIRVEEGTLTGTSLSLNATNITNNSALVYDQNFNGSIGVGITGSGTLTKSGSGALNLTGTSNYSGQTTVIDGTLAINGSISSHTTVSANGTLGGNGLINGNLTNHGTVAPGNSIGTLTVTGDYTTTGTHQVQINDSGSNDWLDVGGTASLSGNVAVQAESGTYTTGMTYTFLQANQISGQYSGITLSGLAPSFSAELGYFSSNGFDYAFFTLFNSQSDFAAIAQTYNELQVATYLDDISTSATGEMRDIIDEMELLPVPEQRVALNQLTGVANGTIAQLGVQDTTFMYMMLRRRVGSAFAAGGLVGGDKSDWASTQPRGSSGGLILPVSYDSSTPSSLPAAGYAAPQSSDPTWSGWTTGYGFGGSAQSDGNAAGTTFGSGGTILAAERALDSSTLFGFFGAYSHLGLSLDGLPQNASANQGLAGGYFLRDFEKGYILAAASAGFAGYQETRRINFGTQNSTATANYDGWQPTCYLEYGRRGQWGRTTVQPYSALQYVYVRQNAFTETGAGTLNLSVNGIDTNALRGLLGLRAAQTWQTDSGRCWIPELRAVWMHEFLQPDTTLTAVFAPIGGSSFATRGLNFGRDWAVLGCGTQYVLNQNVSLFANYDLLVNTQQVWNAGSGGVQVAW
jgi:outer membrane autotransporter protein